jgi:hypothetical protein
MKNQFLAFFIASFLMFYSGVAQAGDYAVVVNSGNSYSAGVDEMKQVVKRIFLKDQTAWPGGEAADPFYRKSGSPEQAALIQNLLGFSDSEMQDHWALKKQTVGDTPPRSIGSSSIVSRQLSRKAGGVAIVSSADISSLSPDVKVLFEF